MEHLLIYKGHKYHFRMTLPGSKKGSRKYKYFNDEKEYERYLRSLRGKQS